MEIDKLIQRLQNFQEIHGKMHVYLTVYECGEELKYPVESLFLDINKNDEHIVIIT